jgi:hypothetical protein
MRGIVLLLRRLGFSGGSTCLQEDPVIDPVLNVGHYQEIRFSADNVAPEEFGSPPEATPTPLFP